MGLNLVDITDQLEVPELIEAKRRYAAYEEAMNKKKAGELGLAVDILEKLCNPPSIYHGHYRELFKIWRQLNKEDIKNEKFEDVITRVLKIIKYNNDLLEEMSRYWTVIHGVERTKEYFAAYSHIKITDAKALLTAASKVNDVQCIGIAKTLIESFSRS